MIAVVAADADAGIDFDFAEDGNTVSTGGACALTVTEDVHRLSAVRTGKGGHVFDDAKNFHVDLAEHFDGFADVGERDSGRRGDHNRAGHSNSLNESELDVAGAGRKINNEVIELTPLGAAQKLRDDAVKHRTAPDHRLVARMEQTHVNHSQARNFDGDDAPVLRGERLLVGAEHDGHVGTVDVGVEK